MFSYRQSVLQNGSKIIISSLGCLYSYIVEFWWCRNGVPIEWNKSVSVGYSGLFVHCPGSVKHFMKSSINLVLSKVSNVCVWGDITMFESISLSSEIKENKSATYVRSYNKTHIIAARSVQPKRLLSSIQTANVWRATAIQ